LEPDPSQVTAVIVLPDDFNVAVHFVDRNIREGRGTNTAVECGDEKVSYRQLLERTNRAGNCLRQLGIDRDQRVIILLPDSPEFLYCFFGTIKIGAVAIPLNTQLHAREYEFFFEDSQARAAVVSDSLLPALRPMLDRRGKNLRVIAAGHAEPSILSLHELMNAASPELEAASTQKTDPAFWLYSSGSTGVAKGCVHRHRDMAVCSELYAKSILRMNGRDRCYSVARLFFAYGLGNAGYFPLSCAATTILSPERPAPAGIYANIERYRPTLFFSVPSNYAALLAHHREGGGDFDLSSIRHAISAGEALPAPIFEQFRKRFGIEILDALGSTEALHMVLSNPPGEVKPGSSGKIIPGYDARILDEGGREVPSGEIGNLLVKGDSICSGYWNQREKSEQTFQGGWFHTGDKYYQDEDGYFWYAGRADDVFKVNGRWLVPVEVESALLEHPAVREAGVVHRVDDNGLTKPAAYVVINPEFTPDEELARTLQQWVADKIGAYKRPRWIEFLPELPKTATGKLQRFKLRQLHQTAASRSGE
jgi:benzoate-CoA ligase family protein